MNQVTISLDFSGETPNQFIDVALPSIECFPER